MQAFSMYGYTGPLEACYSIRVHGLWRLEVSACSSLSPAPARSSRSPLPVRVPVGPQSHGVPGPGSFRRGPRPAAPVGPATAGGAEQRCAEQLLPGSAPWPAVPHRGLRSRRCRAQRTIGDRTCVIADRVVCYAAYDNRSIDELSGRTTSRP